jgi:phosphoserine aminotransferase
MLDYKVLADNNSLYNTPPTFPIYVAELVTKWLQDLGGLEEMHKLNKKKAELLYSFLDSSNLFVYVFLLQNQPQIP